MIVKPGSALLLILGAVVLASCAGQQETPTVAEAFDEAGEQVGDAQALEEIKINAKQVALAGVPPESEVVCERVARTGSHLPTRRCTTRQVQRAEREEAQEWLRSDGQRGSLTTVR